MDPSRKRGRPQTNGAFGGAAKRRPKGLFFFSQFYLDLCSVSLLSCSWWSVYVASDVRIRCMLDIESLGNVVDLGFRLFVHDLLQCSPPELYLVCNL